MGFKRRKPANQPPGPTDDDIALLVDGIVAVARALHVKPAIVSLYVDIAAVNVDYDVAEPNARVVFLTLASMFRAFNFEPAHVDTFHTVLELRISMMSR